MKKVTLTLVALLMAVLPAFSESVSVQTAQRAAQSFLDSRMQGHPQIHLIDFAEKASFPNFYVFGNEHCFVIIAADDRVYPVLGYSMENGVNSEPLPESVFEWLEACDKGIAATKEKRLETSSEIKTQWGNLLNGRGLEPKSRSRVEPLIRTRWQYGTPFNNLCPADTAAHDTGGHAKAGCGAVALSQLMNYWEHPVRGAGSFSYIPSSHPEYGTQYANFSETVYDWDNMRNVYQKTYSDVEATTIATLVYHCGVSVQMNYGPDASGTSTPRLKQALTTYFDYSADMELKDKDTIPDDRWLLLLKNDLDNERPIIYRGQSEDSNGGHIFICDGYDEYDCFHFNWGYLGRWDGFYAMGSLFGGADYSYVNRAIFGIFPNPSSINAPTNVSAIVNGRNVSITWNSINNASSYKVYRDGDLIANNVTISNYTDTNAPYGEHSYYVKSVKSDGTMSLKSNTSIANVHFPGPVPTNLQFAVSGHVVNLLWDTPQPDSSLLQYGAGSVVAGFGKSSNGIHWAQRFSATTLSDYAGMAIQRVSFYVRRSGVSGTYLISIYKGDEANPKELVYQQNYQASSTVGWQDVNFPNPIPIDCTKDLWVVFYADSSISYPAAFCKYSGSGVVDAALYSSVSGGTIWKEYVYTDSNNVIYTCSWLMKTYLTDGTYTYNLYRNGNAVVTNLTGNTYIDGNLPDGIYDYYVTTNYFGGESDPSNTVHVQVGDPTYTIINGYGTSDGGYYLIASPFDNISANDITGMTDGDYDLYRFDQSQEMEWRNYKAATFPLMAGKGYLYAHKTDVALRIMGTQPYNGNGTIALEYVEGHPLTGWNLVGNPYLYEVTSCATEHVAYGCYRMNETKDDLVVSEISEAHPLKPLEACFVRATAENATITFNPHRHDAQGKCESIRIEVAEKGRLADRLIVEQDGANALQKLSLKEKRTKLFATHGQEELSIVPCEGTEQPFCFQAGEEGTYTLTVALEGMKADYLHLFDAETGANVDLLETQSYEFKAKPTDDPCRFKLIIKAAQSGDCNEN